jgi:hypothetical protein
VKVDRKGEEENENDDRSDWKNTGRKKRKKEAK